MNHFNTSFYGTRSLRVRFPRSIPLYYSSFRYPEEVLALSREVSSFYPDSSRVLPGIRELMINAIEHGHLEIGYHLKTELIRNGTWQHEVEKRLYSNAAKEKHARLFVSRTPDSIILDIIDMGQGFDWKPFFQEEAACSSAPSGRGIAIARLLCFDHLHYLQKGNHVQTSVFNR